MKLVQINKSKLSNNKKWHLVVQHWDKKGEFICHWNKAMFLPQQYN